MDRLKKGSLFKQNKGDAEFLAAQDKLRVTLTKKLSRSIKEVQLLFATQEGGGAIGDCRPVLGLCARFEDILRHGLKAKWFSQGTSTFWSVILKISRKQAITYINGLQYAQTENGKCRAWIRLAVNECSLESYIHVLCQDSSLLNQYYESYSFLRDSDMVTTLTQLLAGVSEVTFELTVNTASLEFGDAPEAYQPTLKLKIPVTTSNQKNKEAKTRESSKGQPSKAEQPDTVTVEVEESSSVSSDASFNSSDLKPGKALVQYSPSVSPGESISEADSKIEKSEQEYGNGSVAEDKFGSGAPDEVVYSVSDTNGAELLHYFDSYMQNDEDSLETTKESGDDNIDDYGELEEGCRLPKNETSKDSDGAKVSDEEQVVSDPHAPTPELTAHSECLTNNSESYPNNPLAVESTAQTPPQSSSPPSKTEITTTQSLIERRSTNPFLPNVSTEEMHAAILDQSSANPFSDYEDDSNIDTPVSQSNPFLPQNPFQLGSSERETERDKDDDDGSVEVEEATITKSQVEDLITKPPSEDLVCDDESCVLPSARSRKTTASPDIQKRSSNPFTSTTPPVIEDEHSGDLADNLYDSPNLSNNFPDLHDKHSDLLYRPYDDSNSSQTTPSSCATPSDTKNTTPWEYDVSGLDLSMALENAFDLSRRLSNLECGKLQPKEDHFGSELGVKDLEVAIADLKLRLSSSASSEGGIKHELRKKIVLLQMALHRMKEEEERKHTSNQEVLGHKFVRQPLQIRLTGAMCEGCSHRVRGISRSWYLCQNCQCACHEKCLSQVTRMCIACKDDKEYIFTVCPEKGLSNQYFRCASCNQAFNDQSTKTRLCDYSGLYYCPSCHHNDEAIIPARVVHNWDFTPRKVCCRCCDLLSRLNSRPLVCIQALNPLLYTYVQDLVTVESLRGDLLHMKKYFVQCRRAKETQLLQKLDRFPHFKEDNKLFSLQDLVGAYDNKLLPELNEIYAAFAHHIRKDCPLCAGKGFFCELCNTEEIIYPFDRHVRICPHCNSVYHKACYVEMVVCPKCQRTQSKKKKRS